MLILKWYPLGVSLNVTRPYQLSSWQVELCVKTERERERERERVCMWFYTGVWMWTDECVCGYMQTHVHASQSLAQIRNFDICANAFVNGLFCTKPSSRSSCSHLVFLASFRWNQREPNLWIYQRSVSDSWTNKQTNKKVHWIRYQ